MKYIIAAAVLVQTLVAAAFNSVQWLAAITDDADMLRLQREFVACGQKQFTPAENVVLPLESYADGAIKSRISAKRAYLFLDSGLIWAEGLRVEQFKADGKTLAGILVADNCVVDRKTKSGWVQDKAQLRWGEILIGGKGVYFALEREVIRIARESRIQAKGLKLTKESLL